MPCQDGSLIVRGRSGCIGCPCAQGHAASALLESGGWRLVQAALLFFGGPVLLLLFSAAGTTAFAADQPAWALVGLAPPLGIAAGGLGWLRKAFPA